MQLFRISTTKRGSVLVFALIILSFMLVSALSVATISVTEKRASLATDKSSRSFQVADTGIELMLQKIYGTPSPINLNDLAGDVSGSPHAECDNGEISQTLSTGVSYKVTFYDNSDPPEKIECGDNGWRTKVVRIQSQGTSGNTTRAVSTGIKAP